MEACFGLFLLAVGGFVGGMAWLTVKHPAAAKVIGQVAAEATKAGFEAAQARVAAKAEAEADPAPEPKP